MKHGFVSLALMLVLMLACGSVDASVPATEPVSSLEPTSTLKVEPVASEPPMTATPIDACKLQPFAFTNVGLGLPNPSHKLPSLGEVKTIVLFADFLDVPASQAPQTLFSLVSPDAETFFYKMSYGRMNWTLEPHFVWLRLSQPSAFYGDG